MTETLPLVCSYHHRNNEPCYGEIKEFITEDGSFISFCEGHQGVPSGGPYIPKDPMRRLIFSQQNRRIEQLERRIAELEAENADLRDFMQRMKNLLSEPK